MTWYQKSKENDKKNGHSSRTLSVEECGSGTVAAAKAVVSCGQKNRKAQKKMVKTIHP
jgi:hypothetical protein